LQYPDFTQPFLVTTDASKYVIEGILSQGEIGKDRPIAYISCLLSAAEQNYSTIEKELLAIVHSVNYFRPYLYGHKFSLITDHRPLVWLESVKDPTSRLVCWRLKLAEYEYKVIYKAGKINLNADALSKNPAIPNFPSETTPKTETRNRHKSLVALTYGKDSASYPDPEAVPTLSTKNISAQDPCNFPKSIPHHVRRNIIRYEYRNRRQQRG